MDSFGEMLRKENERVERAKEVDALRASVQRLIKGSSSSLDDGETHIHPWEKDKGFTVTTGLKTEIGYLKIHDNFRLKIDEKPSLISRGLRPPSGPSINLGV